MRLIFWLILLILLTSIGGYVCTRNTVVLQKHTRKQELPPAFPALPAHLNQDDQVKETVYRCC